MLKPSMKQAEWIADRIASVLGNYSADDVFDVLTGQITQPTDFVAEVEYLSRDYEDQLRRGNARIKRS